MNGLYTVAATVCGCCVIVAVLSHFVTDGGTKKLLSLVMGAFILCSMLLPVARAVGGISEEISGISPDSGDGATADEALNRQILAQTKQNLETALADILAQNGYRIDDAEVPLALADGNRVIISFIRITIGEGEAANREEISEITERHFSVKPQIITE